MMDIDTKTAFLNLGRQPIANGFLRKEEFKDEYFFDLGVQYDSKNHLVSLTNFVNPHKLFHDNYSYRTSMSRTMIEHFKNIANYIKKTIKPKNILEIGSNDGAFIKNFNINQATAVEPCNNFAKIISDMGYECYNKFWDDDLTDQFSKKFDVIFAANCMCHIPHIDNAFFNVSKVLSDDGLFIFEDPSLMNTILLNTFDQFYDEHCHVFSIIALKKLLDKQNMEIVRIDRLTTHGNSNRIYAKKKNKNNIIHPSVHDMISHELYHKLDKLQTYFNFSKRVEKIKEEFNNIINKIDGNIIGYGATSKSTVALNYFNIDPKRIKYFIDTTPEKQGKYTPGLHIPILSPSKKIDKKINYVFLGAWNYEEEIIQKEEEFLKRGGKFVTYVPDIRFIENEQRQGIET